jgi:hypothetical protein
MTNKHEVDLVCKEFVDACIMRICVGTNTPKGGDAGSGGRTVIEIDITGGCATSLILLDDKEKEIAEYNSFSSLYKPTLDKIRIILYGDAEARNIIKALGFVSKILKLQYELNSRIKRKLEVD